MATQTEPFRGRIFQEEDLYSILKRVRTAAPKWRWVGLALGFKDSVLDEIEATDKDPKECFRKVLSRWLKWAEPNHEPPSSRSLAEALRSEMVEEERLAKDLEQYFSETGTKDTETVESPPPANTATTSLPHTDTQHTVMVESPSPEERAYDDDILDTQHTVMVESPPTPKKRTSFFDDFILSCTWTAEDELRRLHECYLQSYARLWNKDSRIPLVGRYLALTESVKKALEKRGITAGGITAGAIKDVLQRQSWDESKSYMESVLQQGDELQRAADIQEVLAAVTSRSTFLDYKPLEHLIKTFDLKEAEEELERYKKDLQQFLLLMMEAPPDTDPPPRKKSRVGPDPEVRREQGTLV